MNNKKLVVLLRSKFNLRLSTATLIVDNLKKEDKLSLIIEVLFSENLIAVVDRKEFLLLINE